MDLPVTAAREAAQQSRIDLRKGWVPSKVNLRVWEEAHRRGLSDEDAHDAAFAVDATMQTPEERRRDGPWEWGDLVDCTLPTSSQISERGGAGQYEKHLRRTVEGPLARKLVAAVTQGGPP